jgi:glycosyltransferase involved in cell wall biosynthesis
MTISSSQMLIPYLFGSWPKLNLHILDTYSDKDLESWSSVGVIVPAHNAAETIVETTQSLLKAVRKDDVIYIVENGSRDHTWLLLNKHFGMLPNIRLYQTTQANASIARNMGVTEAKKHEYIAFCDADDLWMPNKIQIIRCIIEAQKPDLIFHPLLSVGEKRLELEGSAFMNKDLPRTSRFYWDLACYGNFLPTSSLVIRRSLLKTPAFLPELQHTQDYEAWCAATHGCVEVKVAYADVVLGIHRWMGGLSKEISARLLNVWSISTSYVSDAPLLVRLAAVARTLTHVIWWAVKQGEARKLIRIINNRQDIISLRSRMRKIENSV